MNKSVLISLAIVFLGVIIYFTPYIYMQVKACNGEIKPTAFTFIKTEGE